MTKGSLPGIGNFGELAKRLIRVPKDEIEAEERKYKAMRKRLKEKKAKGRKRAE
jgi:hypothetical protein